MIIRNTDNITEFKNGNMNIHFSPENIADIRADKIQNSGLYTLINALEWNDCYFIGDSFSLGNFSMGQLIYSCRRDKCYILDLSDIDNVLMAGRTLKLYAHDPSDNEREQINSEMGVSA